MSIPFFIKPEYLNTISLNGGERRIESNYFVPGMLNVITSMSRSYELNKSTMMNIIAGSNLSGQIITLPSDPVIMNDMYNNTDCAKLSIHYALSCINGINLPMSYQINIITPVKTVYDELYNIFRVFKFDRFNLIKIKDFRSRLRNNIDILIFNDVMNMPYNLNLLFVKKEYDNIYYTLQIFSEVNVEYIPATIFDMCQFQGFIQYCSITSSNLNKGHVDQLDSLSLTEIRNKTIPSLD